MGDALLRSIEFSYRSLLFRAHAPGGDMGEKIVFAAHRAAGQAAEHSNLADVRERVGDGPLKQFLGRKSKGFLRRQAPVESPERGKEARDFPLPGLRRRIAPNVFPLGKADRPIEQVADVRQDLTRRARPGRHLELREFFRSAPHGFASTVGERCHRVTEREQICLHMCPQAVFGLGSLTRYGRGAAMHRQSPPKTRAAKEPV